MIKEQCLCLQDSKKDDAVAVPVCVYRNMNVIVLPHPIGNWSWKSSACACRTARQMMRLPCLCLYRNMNVIIPPHPTQPHPTPPVTDDERAVPVSAGHQERWWVCRACVCIGTSTLLSHPTPPHPTPPVTDDERVVPASAGQQERWWGCRACVCTGTWTFLSHPTPTPPHPTGNWRWKSNACVCGTARKMMRLPCLCVYRNMKVITPLHPTPPHR